MKSSKSFTLIEVLVALFILVAVIAACSAVVAKALSTIQVTKSKLIAANLAQEGIEIARNIRDNNWLSQLAAGGEEAPTILWNNGLSQGNYEAAYNSQNLEPYQSRPLLFTNSFYNYQSGIQTKFKRKITIQEVDENQLRVISMVEWQERGKSYNIAAVEDLYNWFQYSGEELPPSPPPPECYYNGTLCSSGSECCSGYCYVDTDGDGYAPSSGTKTCRANSQLSGVDCEDNNASVYPGVACSTACQICQSSGSCAASSNTGWGANLYGCSGSSTRCYGGTCRTCDGYLYSDGCSGCAGQGGNACWRQPIPQVINLSCNTICSDYGGCVPGNWNIDTSCTACCNYMGCPSGCTSSSSTAAPYGENNVCYYRVTSNHNCAAASSGVTMCVCAY